MAAKVQLDIESKANTQALKQAIADLEKLGMAGKSTNQVFGQTNNLEGYKAALVKSYETARTFGDQMKATRTAFSDTNKAIKAAQAYLGENKNNMFTFIDEKGMQQQTRDMALIEKQIRGFLGNVVADTQNFQQSVTRTMGEFKGFDNYTKGIERTAQAYRDMGNDIGAVQYKMTAIQQQVLDMTAANADPAEIKKLTDEYKKLAAEHKELSEAANGTGTRIKNLIKNFVSAQLIVWAIRKAFQLLTQGLKEASTAAAEAEQVFGRFDAVFEGLERANAAVSEMVDNFGVAKSSAADILASIGNTALGFGASAMEAAQFSETVAKSLSDIMAFRDVQGTISDFAQRFMSGASGNVQNFRALGSVVRETMVDLELQKQGWDNLTGQQLEWAKVQARVNIVLEQQKKAIGATEREWETLLSIQRRNAEQSKQMKENIGETVNQFFKPMSEWILTLKENWNAAYEANKRYNEGVYDPSGGTDFAKTPTARVLESRVKSYTGLYGNAVPNMFMHQAKTTIANYTPWGSDKMGALKVGDDPNLKNARASYKQIKLLAEQYQATLSYTATLVEKYGFKVSSSVWEQIDAYDAYIRKLNEYRKAESDRIAASQAEADAIAAFQADIGAKMGLGRSAGMPDVKDYVGKGASGFVSPLERLLGFDGGDEAELEAKIKNLSNLVETLFNASISGSTEYIRTQASEMLSIVSTALKEAQDEMKIISQIAKFDEQNESLFSQIKALEKRNSLVAQYGKNNSDVVDLLMQQWEAEQQALKNKNEAVSAGMDMNDAEKERLKTVKLIAEYYGKQLAALKDLKYWTEILDERKTLVESGTGAVRAIQQANTESELMRAVPWNATEMERAGYQRDVAIKTMGPELEEFARSLLTDKNKEIADNAGMSAVRFLGGLKNKELETFNAYKLAREKEIENEYLDKKKSIENEYLQKLQDTYDGVQGTLESMWEGMGDVGMVAGWKDMFDTVKEYAMSEAGGSKSEDEASSMAWGDVGKMVLLEFLGQLESVNELLSIVSKFIEYVAPAVDQFLAPLMPVLEMLLSITADILLPILQILFPIIQGLSVVLIYLMAVIKTVTNSFSWLVDTIATAIYNIIHPFRQRAFRNLGDETVEIWSDANAKVEEIWNMELDTRMEFVDKLTDAQKGQLDAYNEMFKSGLLTLTQYQAMVGKNVYGKNFDNVDIQSFASGGNFITNGEQIIRVGEAGREHVQITPLNSTGYANRNVQQVGGNSYSVVVNGANGDPEEIAMAVRQEFKRMERRGVRYA